MDPEERESKRHARRYWHRHARIRSKGHYIGRIVSGFIFLIMVNLYVYWQPLTAGVVTSSWVNVLWAIDLSLVTRMAGNLLLIIYNPRWLRYLVDFVSTSVGLISAAVFLAVFPVDFAKIGLEWLNTLLRIFAIIGVCGASIATVVTAVRFIFFSWRVDTTEEEG